MNSDKSPVYDQMNADKAKENPDRSEEARIPMYEEMLAKESENRTKEETPEIKVGEFKMPIYDEMLKEKVVTAPESDVPLNKPVEKVKEGDVSSLESKRVVYGAAKEGMVARQLREFEELKGKDIKSDVGSIPTSASAEKTPKDLALERQIGKGATPEQLKDFEKVYVGWKEARANSDRLEKEFNEKYTQHLEKESKGWRKIANLPRKLFGVRPKLTSELQALEGASQVARRDYFEKARLLKDSKLNPEGHTYGEVGRTTAALREKRSISAESKGVDAVEMSKSEKVLARYQQMLAHKIVVGVHERRVAIQEKIALEADKNSKLRPILEKVNKYKYVRIGAISLGYAALAGATGGVGAAVLAGGGYATRVGAGMVAGGYVGSLMRGLGRNAEKGARDDLGKLQGEVKNDFFDRGFMEADNAVDKLTRDIQKIRGITNTGSAAAAVVAGFGVGAMANPDIFGVEKGGDTPPPSPGEGKFINDGNNPGNPNAPGYYDIKGPEPKVDYVNDGNNPGNPNAPGYFDIDLPHKVEVPGDIPRTELEGVPSDLVKPPLKEMGDASVAEAVSKETAEIIKEIENGDRPRPEFKSVHPEYDGPKHHTPGGPGWGEMPEVKGEVTPPNPVPPEGLEGVPPGLEKAPDNTYVVQKGDNLWNIMEGKGPDSNPTGGQSEVLKGMSLADRRSALDTLFDYAEKNPEFAKEAGVLKSGGDVHKIYPGESVNVSMLDSKLRELLGLEIRLPETAPVPESSPLATPTEAPTPTPRPETVPTPTPRPDTLPEVAPVPTPSPEVAVTPEVVTEAAEAARTVNDLTVNEFNDLLARVTEQRDPSALAEFEAMGLDGASARDIAESLNNRTGELNGDLTIGDYLKNTEPLQASVTESTPSEPVASEVRNASATNVEAKVGQYVKDIERSSGGFIESLFGMNKPSVEGSFEQMKGLQVAQILEADAAGTQANGVSAEGWGRWVDALKAQTKLIPATDGESLGQYINRVSSGNRVV